MHGGCLRKDVDMRGPCLFLFVENKGVVVTRQRLMKMVVHLSHVFCESNFFHFPEVNESKKKENACFVL